MGVMQNGKTDRKKRIRVIVGITTALLVAVLVSGFLILRNTRVVFTTGFDPNELFIVGKASATTEEWNVYMVNTMNQYVDVYGEDILYRKMNGTTLQRNIMEMSLARLTKIKIMNLLAEEYDIVLTPEEQNRAAAAAEAYYATLAQEEIAVLGVDVALLAGMYREYALAEKVYASIIEDITPEISDDEARIITVSQILFKTYYYDAKGVKQRYGMNARIDIHKRALGVRDRLQAGESFELLATEFNEAEETTILLGKGEKDISYEEAAFRLGNGEISDIVETEDGYVILKCLNAYDREETDANKMKILDEYKRKGFDEIYEQFARGLDKKMNDRLWDRLTLEYSETVATKDFWRIYGDFFGTRNNY